MLSNKSMLSNRNVKILGCKYCGKEHYVSSETTDFLCENCMKRELLGESIEFYKNIKEEYSSPKDLMLSVSDVIAGQEGALRNLSTEFYKHILRNSTFEIKGEKRKFKKNNILLCGPTASGKTYMVETLARKLNIPYISVDITTITPNGYVGGNIEDIFKELIIQNPNMEIAQRGIVFLDEIDKICEKESTTSPDLKGKLMQESLLKTIEGTVLTIKAGDKAIKFDTTNVLFICAGAFVGISDIIKKRLKISDKKNIGFCNAGKVEEIKDEEYYRSFVTEKDFIEYGFIPEFMGRVPIKLTLNKLTEEDIKKALLSEEGIIKEYIDLFELEGKTLMFDEKSIRILSNMVLKSDIGMRSMRSIMAELTNDILFDIVYTRKRKILITEDIIKQYLGTKYNTELDFILNETLVEVETEKSVEISS